MNDEPAPPPLDKPPLYDQTAQLYELYDSVSSVSRIARDGTGHAWCMWIGAGAMSELLAGVCRLAVDLGTATGVRGVWVL